MSEAQAPMPDFAVRLNRLVDTIRRPDGKRFSAREITEEVNRRQGERTISHAYVANLLAGRSANPTLTTLTVLAEFFDVPVSYFVDDATMRKVDAELELINALRTAGVQQIAARMAGLSDKSLTSIAQIVEQIRQIEGLADDRS